LQWAKHPRIETPNADLLDISGTHEKNVYSILLFGYRKQGNGNIIPFFPSPEERCASRRRGAWAKESGGELGRRWGRSGTKDGAGTLRNHCGRWKKEIRRRLSQRCRLLSRERASEDLIPVV
jgi:hypothetical protein